MEMMSFEGSEQSILQRRLLASSVADGLWGTSSGFTAVVQWMSVSKVKVKESHNRPGVAQRVPEGLGSRIS
jgi:hypothetical protein